MMTKDFEPITEVGIHQDDFGEGTVTLKKLVVSQLSIRSYSGSPDGDVFTHISLFCREVHHRGLGEEGDSVSWLRGQTGSTEEDPGPF